MDNSNTPSETLDIINCADFWYEVIKNHAYICPVEGSSYKHKNCKYFGLYREKSINAIGEIEAVIDVYSMDKAEIQWINGTKDIEIYVAEAKEKAVRLRSYELPRRVFILANLSSTDFVKDSKGGMQTSKMYLEVDNLNVSNAKELAVALRGKKWSDFGL